jgi:hypothetical protein
MILHPPAVFLWRVTGSQKRSQLGKGLFAESLRSMTDAGQRGPEVSLDIMGQSFERGDVEDPAPFVRLRKWLGEEPIEGPEECSKRLPRAGGGMNQGVLTRRNGRPS